MQLFSLGCVHLLRKIEWGGGGVKFSISIFEGRYDIDDGLNLMLAKKIMLNELMREGGRGATIYYSKLKYLKYLRISLVCFSTVIVSISCPVYVSC